MVPAEAATQTGCRRIGRQLRSRAASVGGGELWSFVAPVLARPPIP